MVSLAPLRHPYRTHTPRLHYMLPVRQLQGTTPSRGGCISASQSHHSRQRKQHRREQHPIIVASSLTRSLLSCPRQRGASLPTPGACELARSRTLP